MPSLDRPAYIDWEGEWWWSSRVRFTLPKALQMTYCELCWRVFLDGGSTRKDIPYLAKFHMDTEENICTILAIDHFYDNGDGTFSHHVVDKKLEEQRGRRTRASRGGVAKAQNRASAGSTATSSTSSTAGSAAGGRRNAGSLASETVKGTSEKRTGGTSASRSSLAPAGRGAGAGTRPAEAGPVHPDAKFPTEYDRNDPESVRAKDGGWIHLPTGDRLPPPKG